MRAGVTVGAGAAAGAATGTAAGCAGCTVEVVGVALLAATTGLGLRALFLEFVVLYHGVRPRLSAR